MSTELYGSVWEMGGFPFKSSTGQSQSLLQSLAKGREEPCVQQTLFQDIQM